MAEEFRVNGLILPNTDSSLIPEHCRWMVERFEYVWTNYIKPEILKHDDLTLSADLSVMLILTNRIDKDTMEFRIQDENSELKIFEKRNIK